MPEEVLIPDRHAAVADRPAQALGGDHAPRATAPLAWVLLLVTVFIVYGSLYPFVFHRPAGDSDAFGALIGTWREWDGRGDLLSNILLYMPFGFLATHILRPRIPAVVRVSVAILAGGTLSAGMELAQFYDEGRVSSMGDVYANTIGAAVGASASALLGAGMRWPLVRELNAQPDASLLLAAFLGYRLYPYVPTIDLHKYLGVIRGLLRQPIPVPADLARFGATWLFIAVVVESLYGFRRGLLLFPLLALGVFVGRIMIVDLSLTSADVAGAAIAFILWAFALLAFVPWGEPLRWPRARRIGLACVFAGVIAALRLEPFTFSAVPQHDFGWVPFWSLMHGSIGVAIQAFLEKFYQYGGLIWLLRRAGMSLTSASALTAALLLATSIAEVYLPGRSGEMTDAAMALTIGAAFGLLGDAGRAATRLSRSHGA